MTITQTRSQPRLFRALLALLALLMASLLSSGAQAHVFKTSGAYIFFDQDLRYFGIQMDLNLEAILAGIDPKLKDTSESPNAAEYDRLRRLPPEELRKEFEKFRQEFIDGLRIKVDGKRVVPTIKEEVFREVGDLSKPRKTTLKVFADLPKGAKYFTFGWAKRFGDITIRTSSKRARDMRIEVISDGQTSSRWVIADLKARTLSDMVGDFLKIGFVHIVPKGTDHILFVLGIFLLSIRLRPILLQVTSFTVAHTVTLGLGTLGIVSLSPSIVEPLIAASIVYVAVENIYRPTLSPWRPAVVFMFGLLHGLGFAGILKQFGIPEGDFLVGLLSFNAGVELGQLTVIGGAFLLVGIWFGNKPWYRQRVVIPGSLAIAVVGAFWFVQRVFFT